MGKAGPGFFLWALRVCTSSLEFDMSIPSRCPYCQEAMPSSALLTHIGECPVRTAVLDAEARLGRVLTEEEIVDIRERF